MFDISQNINAIYPALANRNLAADSMPCPAQRQSFILNLQLLCKATLVKVFLRSQPIIVRPRNLEIYASVIYLIIITLNKNL